MTYHIAICDDSRDAGYVSELLHQWAQLRGCAVTEERSPSTEGFLFRYEEDRSFDRLKRRGFKGGILFGKRIPPFMRVPYGKTLSPEARSCRGRRVRGSADGAHSDRPARRCWTPPGSSPGPAPGTAGR